MEPIITEAAKRRKQRYAAIVRRYLELVAVKGAQVSAVVEAVANEYGCGKTTVYKAKRLYLIQREQIDKVAVYGYCIDLLNGGMAMSHAVTLTADAFKISKGYTYRILRDGGLKR